MHFSTPLVRWHSAKAAIVDGSSAAA